MCGQVDSHRTHNPTILGATSTSAIGKCDVVRVAVVNTKNARVTVARAAYQRLHIY